jgi:hypothetical protein
VLVLFAPHSLALAGVLLLLLLVLPNEHRWGGEVMLLMFGCLVVAKLRCATIPDLSFVAIA